VNASPEALARVRTMVAGAQSKGLDWGAMHRAAHKTAEGLGMDIAAAITNPNVAFDADLAKLLGRAQRMRDDYAAFSEIWWADACARNAAIPREVGK
jgi:hypothetical protein